MISKRNSAFIVIIAVFASMGLQGADDHSYKGREFTRTSHRLFILPGDCERAFTLSSGLTAKQWFEQANQHTKSVEMCSREYAEIGLGRIKDRLVGINFAEVLSLVKQKRAARKSLDSRPNSERRKSKLKLLTRQLKNHSQRESYLELKWSQRFLKAVLKFEANERLVRAACAKESRKRKLIIKGE